MKTIVSLMAWPVIFIFFASPLFAREHPRKSLRQGRETPAAAQGSLNLDHLKPDEIRMVAATTEADTFVLGSWNFEPIPSCDPQGWISVDRTLQDGCYFHIDDFIGLGGGDFGRLVPLQGSQSLWCGARPDTTISPLCNYAVLPGYGNEWDQSWCFDCIEVPDTESISIDYLISWDTETDYDFVYLEYATKSTCDSLQTIDDIYYQDWVELYALDGIGVKQLRSDTIPAGHRGAVKIRFHFESDAFWSDEDGLWDTDGAILLDSITVQSASAVYDFEDFEDESPGDLATTDGDWECCIRSGVGDYAGLYYGVTILQEDPCGYNLTCMWAFINGSTVNYACGGHPEQTAVTYGEDPDRYILNEIWSPLVEWQGSGSQVELQFDVYRDLELDGLIFYEWHVRSLVNECLRPWRDRGYIYWGSNKDWLTDIQNVSDLIEPDASHVQVALGVRDMCEYWCDIYGHGICHSHAPLFDNIKLYRIDNHGPVWNVDPVHLFQDNFASDGTLTGKVRADMADDIMPYDNPSILPGDSVVVSVNDLENGIGTCPVAGGPAVYMYTAVRPKFQTDKVGAALSGDLLRWPLVDSLISAGNNWYVFRMDTVFSDETGAREDPVPNQFCVDLNDNLFVPGDTVFFFFKAISGPPANNTTYWSEFTGSTTSLSPVVEDPMEFTCLPAGWYGDLSDKLYVDNYDGLGAEPYFQSVFNAMWFEYGMPIDRYDVRGGGSRAGNSLAGRVVNVPQQLIARYRTIIWNSGDIVLGTVGMGDVVQRKEDDYGVLHEFLDQHTQDNAGIYFSGDNIAQELSNRATPSSQNFANNFMPHVLITGNHTEFHRISPLGIGEGTGTGSPPSAGIFDNGPYSILGIDTLVVFGGCPVINDFDVIAPSGGSTLEMCYDPFGESDDSNPAIVAYETTNSLGNRVAVVLSGFSFHNIRTDKIIFVDPYGYIPIEDQIIHFHNIMLYLGVWNEIIIGGVEDGTPSKWTNQLAQNYPNPFNPVTTILYSIKERTHVSLKIYDVAGRLVKTLVNEIEQPGVMHEVRWDGRSNSGDPVASGVYFYKIVTKDFSKTRKMVLLK
jgi:hypothetical protein